MSAAGEMQLNPGVVAQDIRGLGLINLLYLHLLAQRAAVLAGLGQKFGLNVTNTREASRGLLRNKIAAFAVLHDGRVRGTRRAKNYAQGNKQFITCSHLFTPSRIATGAGRSAGTGNKQIIACSSHRAVEICVVSSFLPLFYGSFSRVHEKKLVKKA
jgi:hypothetical protein